MSCKLILTAYVWKVRPKLPVSYFEHGKTDSAKLCETTMAGKTPPVPCDNNMRERGMALVSLLLLKLFGLRYLTNCPHPLLLSMTCTCNITLVCCWISLLLPRMCDATMFAPMHPLPVAPSWIPDYITRGPVAKLLHNGDIKELHACGGTSCTRPAGRPTLNRRLCCRWPASLLWRGLTWLAPHLKACGLSLMCEVWPAIARLSRSTLLLRRAKLEIILLARARSGATLSSGLSFTQFGDQLALNVLTSCFCSYLPLLSASSNEEMAPGVGLDGVPNSWCCIHLPMSKCPPSLMCGQRRRVSECDCAVLGMTPVGDLVSCIKPCMGLGMAVHVTGDSWDLIAPCEWVRERERRERERERERREIAEIKSSTPPKCFDALS